MCAWSSGAAGVLVSSCRVPGRGEGCGFLELLDRLLVAAGLGPARTAAGAEDERVGTEHDGDGGRSAPRAAWHENLSGRLCGLGWVAPGGPTADAAMLSNLCAYLGHSGGGDKGDGGDGSGGGQGGGQGGGSGDSGPIGESGSIERTALTRRSLLATCWRGGCRSLLRPSPPGWSWITMAPPFAQGCQPIAAGLCVRVPGSAGWCAAGCRPGSSARRSLSRRCVGGG
jgi:hypothetical protein